MGRLPLTGRLSFILIVIAVIIVRPCHMLLCYECSEEFSHIWEPRTCQVNVTYAPSRQCNDEQPFCFVTLVTVKGIVTSISRDCTDECFYGCQASGFGTTSMTCTTCCDEDHCNDSDSGLVQRCPAVVHWLGVFVSVVSVTGVL
ncbi:unnamed protein product [Lymnaea stagnalis]|uniref:Uncharacterized protein n=1 Tax=Lymnaea stagnalis TaxID=6523 RepID=A0AAV2I4J8_LYMST